MKFYSLLLLSILLSNSIVFAQKGSVSSFEKAKGTLTFPVSNYLEVTKSFFDSSLNFKTKDTCALHSISNGIVLKVKHLEDDELYVITIIRSDSFYITYAGVFVPEIKEGDSIRTCQKIATISKDENNEYGFSLYISTSTQSLNPALWFKQRNVIKQLSAGTGVY